MSLRAGCNAFVLFAVVIVATSFIKVLARKQWRLSIKGVAIAVFFICLALASLHQLLAGTFGRHGAFAWALVWACLGAAIGSLARSVALAVGAATCLAICSFIVLICNLSVWF